jgi:hypothetical protein
MRLGATPAIALLTNRNCLEGRWYKWFSTILSYAGTVVKQAGVRGDVGIDAVVFVGHVRQDPHQGNGLDGEHPCGLWL